MTTQTRPKPTPIPTLLVYGAPTSPELTQASWFRAEDKQAAEAAAVGLKFSVIEIETDRPRCRHRTQCIPQMNGRPAN